MDTEKVANSNSAASASRSAAEIQQWLICQIAEELQIPTETVAPDQPLLSSGIDSLQLISVVAKLEDWLGFRFTGNPMEDYSTIRDLSVFVAQLTSGRSLPGNSAGTPGGSPN